VDIPSRQEQGWLTAFGVAAIYIAWSPASTRCAIGATQDLAKALATQRGMLGRDTELHRVWWIPSLEAALELAGTAGGLAPDTNTAVEVVEHRIREVARRCRIPLAEHGPTLERARTALTRFEHRLKLAQQRGVLQEFNARGSVGTP